MAYNRVNWEDSPSTNTPVNATNLNTMDAGIEQNANDIEDLQDDVDEVKSNLKWKFLDKKTTSSSNRISLPDNFNELWCVATGSGFQFTIPKQWITDVDKGLTSGQATMSGGGNISTFQRLSVAISNAGVYISVYFISTNVNINSANPSNTASSQTLEVYYR